jgi:hypothetical protein
MIPKNTWNQIMMHHDTHADALLADRTGAIAIAQLAGWEIDPAANLLMFCACAPCLFAPEPQLLIVPFTSGRDNALAMRAMADTRSDVVMVVVTPNREVRFGLVLRATTAPSNGYIGSGHRWPTAHTGWRQSWGPIRAMRSVPSGSSNMLPRLGKMMRNEREVSLRATDCFLTPRLTVRSEHPESHHDRRTHHHAAVCVGARLFRPRNAP